MENASQALIIAGAILLAILIVALGVTVFNNARGGIDEGAKKLNQQQIKAQNQLIENYTNRRIKGIELKELLADIRVAVQSSDAPAANSVGISFDDQKQPNLNGGAPVEKITKDDQKDDFLKKIGDLRNAVKVNEYYKVTEGEVDNGTGLIKSVVLHNGN